MFLFNNLEKNEKKRKILVSKLLSGSKYFQIITIKVIITIIIIFVIFTFIIIVIINLSKLSSITKQKIEIFLSKKKKKSK